MYNETSAATRDCARAIPTPVVVVFFDMSDGRMDELDVVLTSEVVTALFDAFQ